MARTGGRQRTASASQLDEDSDLFVRALARGLSILALFDVQHPDWSLNAISDQADISKTTAYRMLRTLEAKGFLTYDPATERYHVGKATIPLGYLALSYVGFVRSAHQFLEDLAEATGETVELTVSGSQGAVVVDQVMTKHPFRLNLPTGRILTDLANSSCRMHVAFLPPAEQEKYLRQTQQRFTPNTQTDREMIEGRLVSDREEGLSSDMEELDKGVCAVSAPVFERDGSLRAVLTVVAPAERFGPRDRKRLVEALKTTAAKVTKSLGGQAGVD